MRVMKKKKHLVTEGALVLGEERHSKPQTLHPNPCTQNPKKGSYSRLIDFVCQFTLGLRVSEKKKKHLVAEGARVLGEERDAHPPRTPLGP